MCQAPCLCPLPTGPPAQVADRRCKEGREDPADRGVGGIAFLCNELPVAERRSPYVFAVRSGQQEGVRGAAVEACDVGWARR